MSKDPAFLFYSKDWLEGTAELTPSEKGVYIDLLSHQQQKGSLPADTFRLSRLVTLPEEEFLRIWETLSGKFEKREETRSGPRPGEPGGPREGEDRVPRLVNPRLEELINERRETSLKNRVNGLLPKLFRELGVTSKSERKRATSDFYAFFSYEEFKGLGDEEIENSLRDKLRSVLQKETRSGDRSVNRSAPRSGNGNGNGNGNGDNKNCKSFLSAEDLGEFSGIWEDYLAHREEIRAKMYKSERSERIAFNKLLEHANGDKETAQEIVNNSRAYGWQGLFPLKNGSNGKAKTYRPGE